MSTSSTSCSSYAIAPVAETNQHYPADSQRKTVGIYLRKSSQKQGELSLPAQERLIRTTLVEPGHLHVYAVYRDILSGTRPDRIGYQQMLADARAGKLAMIAFHKVNRFGRNAAEGLAAIDELRRLGIEIRIADLPTLDLRTPEGMFIFTFLLGQGQYEVENLSSEARKGMQQKLIEGGWVFRAPDGYCNVREKITSHKDRCRVNIVRHRAAIIRLIFTWYAHGTMTLADIVKNLHVLHEQRVSQGKTGCLRPHGGRWYPQVIAKIFDNQFYIGIVNVPRWGITHTGTHRPIIRREVYDRVHEILKTRTHGPRHRHAYLLQHLLVLEPDGVVLLCTRAKQKQYPYYYRVYDDGRRQYFDADRLDREVYEAMQSRVALLGDNPVEALRLIIVKRIRTDRRAMQERLETIQEQRQRMLHQATRGYFTDAEIAGEMTRLNSEREWALREIARVDMLATSQDELLAEALSCLEAYQKWTMISTADQHRIVTGMIQRVIVTAEGSISRIEWNIPWSMISVSA